MVRPPCARYEIPFYLPIGTVREGLNPDYFFFLRDYFGGVASAGSNLPPRYQSPSRPPVSSSRATARVMKGRATSACALRLMIRRTMRSTHSSTGQIRKGGDGGVGHVRPLPSRTRCRNGVSTKPGETTPT